jgi:hypothetical protein
VSYRETPRSGGEQQVIVKDVAMFEEEVASWSLRVITAYRISCHDICSPKWGLPPAFPDRGEQRIDSTICEKAQFLRVMGERLQHFQRYDTPLLLRNVYLSKNCYSYLP